MPAIPNVDVSAPATSKCPGGPGFRAGRRVPTRRTATPIGTFTNITQRHETSWVSAPPATSPTAPPAAETVVNSPIARPAGAPLRRWW